MSEVGFPWDVPEIDWDSLSDEEKKDEIEQLAIDQMNGCPFCGSFDEEMGLGKCGCIVRKDKTNVDFKD